VLPDRKAATLTAWLREHPGAEVVCRDGSAAYAEAIRQGAPEAVQVSDRWHLWHGLGGAVEKTVIAHSPCWRTQPQQPQPPRLSGQGRVIDERTRTRHAAVHELLGQGVGLLECARRLGWALNTVKRYARAATAEQLQRPPRYGRTHTGRPVPRSPAPPAGRRPRRAGDPAAHRDPRAGLHRQRQPARALPQPRPRPRPARLPATAALVGWIMSKPAELPEHEHRHLDELLAACPPLTVLAEHVRAFADLLTSRRSRGLDDRRRG
jgi:hypothetical protein